MNSRSYRAATGGDIAFLKTAAAAATGAEVFLSELTPKKNSILHIAAEAGKLDFLEEATTLFPWARTILLYRKNSDGDTALHLAVRMGHPEVVDFIIEQARAPCSDDDFEVPERFQSTEPPLQIVNMNGDSVLHLAARHGHLQIAESLIKAAADSTIFNFVNKANESPFFVAVDNVNHDVAALIFTSSPSPAARSQILMAGKTTTTVLHALCSSYSVALRVSDSLKEKALKASQENSSTEDWYNLMEEVIDEAPELAKQGDSRGWTPLHYAADSDITQVVKLLLQKDPSTAYLVNNNGESPLHIAASRGHVFSMNNLIGACPDCWDIQDKRGRTALHAAVVAAQQGSVDYMLSLRNSMLVNEEDEDGNTALHLAALHNKGDDKILKILQRDIRTHILTLNKESSTVVDILARQIHQKEEEERVMEKQEKTKSRGYFGGFIEISGVMLATIAFTAPFSMPGGFIQSGGPNEGMAVVSSKAFNSFVIFDIFAFFLSSYPVFFRLMNVQVSLGSFVIVAQAYSAIALAFACGLYAILGGALRSASLVICLLFTHIVPFVLSFVSLIDWFNKLRQQYPDDTLVELLATVLSNLLVFVSKKLDHKTTAAQQAFNPIANDILLHVAKKIYNSQKYVHSSSSVNLSYRLRTVSHSMHG